MNVTEPLNQTSGTPSFNNILDTDVPVFEEPADGFHLTFHPSCDRRDFESKSIPYDIQSLQLAREKKLYIGIYVDANCDFLPFALHPEVKFAFLDYFQVEEIEVRLLFVHSKRIFSCLFRKLIKLRNFIRRLSSSGNFGGSQ